MMMSGQDDVMRAGHFRLGTSDDTWDGGSLSRERLRLKGMKGMKG